MLNNLAIVFCILVIILFIKTYLESNPISTFIDIDLTEKFNQQNILDKIKANINFQNDINKMIFETQQKINKAVESGIKEGFQTIQNSIQNKSEKSYLNKMPTVKLQLFYKKTCPHCKYFMNTWYSIINNLPSEATYEEIECDENRKKAIENAITSVPTIILIINDQKIQYQGNRNYDSIKEFLRYNGVNLVERNFEKFNNSDEIKFSSNCPSVTFDKQIDIAEDNYLYQIFNADGQFGYAIGGYNSDKVMTPFQAAYSTIDSYLSSLPDPKNPTVNTYDNIDECANIYADNIINFGLCDKEALDKISEYQQQVQSGNAKPRFSDTDYTNNTKVVNAIKKICKIN